MGTVLIQITTATVASSPWDCHHKELPTVCWSSCSSPGQMLALSCEQAHPPGDAEENLPVSTLLHGEWSFWVLPVVWSLSHCLSLGSFLPPCILFSFCRDIHCLSFTGCVCVHRTVLTKVAQLTTSFPLFNGVNVVHFQ